jgi:hypothetical protein
MGWLRVLLGDSIRPLYSQKSDIPDHIRDSFVFQSSFPWLFDLDLDLGRGVCVRVCVWAVCVYLRVHLTP